MNSTVEHFHGRILKLKVRRSMHVKRHRGKEYYSHSAYVTIPKASKLYYADEVVIMDVSVAKELARYINHFYLDEDIDAAAIEFLRAIGVKMNEERDSHAEG